MNIYSMDLKREDRLLLECLKGNGDSFKNSQMERLTGADWDGVVRQSVRHSVAPILYRRLKYSNLDIPSHVFERLQKIYLGNLGRNLRIYHELSKNLKILQESGIPIVLLKGSHLGEFVYQNIGLRPMSDVDLLLRKRDLAKAQKVLLDVGYSASSTQLPIDLHTNIESLDKHLDIDLQGVWDRVQRIRVNGIEVSVLCPEDLLLHLCIHLSFHHLYEFAGLRTLCDIQETIKHYSAEIDWKEFEDRAMNWGVANAVYLTLVLARDLLDAEIPEITLERLMPKHFGEQMKTWALEQVFHSNGNASDLSPYFWQLWNPGPVRKKFSNFVKLMLPSAEFVAQEYFIPYNSARNYVHYLTRLRIHFRRYLRVTHRILTRKEEMVPLIERENRNIAMREWLTNSKEHGARSIERRGKGSKRLMHKGMAHTA